MAKKSTPAKKPALVSNNETPEPSNKPAPELAVASGGEPPQSALHAKVVAYMDGIRKATTTDLHALAVECMEHGEKTGDLRPLLAFQNYMPKSLRKVQFMPWASSFGPIKWDKRDAQDNATGISKDKSAKAKPWDIEGCKAVAFFDVAEAVKPKGISDTVKMLMQKREQYKQILAGVNSKGEPITRKDGVTDEAINAEIAKLDLAIKAVA